MAPSCTGGWLLLSHRGKGGACTAPGIPALVCRDEARQEKHAVFESSLPCMVLGSGRCSHPRTPAASTALPCSQLSSPGEGSRSLRSTPSSSQGPSKPHWPPQALPSSCNRVKNYFADGKPAVRSPGRQRTQLSLHRRGPDPLQAGSVKRLSYYLRPWNRQSKLRHPTKHHSKGFARPLVFGQELMPVFVSDPS